MFEPQKAEPALSAKGPRGSVGSSCYHMRLGLVIATGRSLAREGLQTQLQGAARIPRTPEPQRPKPMNSSREPEVARACGWLYDS